MYSPSIQPNHIFNRVKNVYNFKYFLDNRSYYEEYLRRGLNWDYNPYIVVFLVFWATHLKQDVSVYTV